MKTIALLAFIALTLTGCTPAPTFDADHPHRSAAAMQDTLPKSQRELFEASIGYLSAKLLFTPEMEAIALTGDSETTLAAAAAALADLNGLTARQIIKAGNLSAEQVKQWQRFVDNGFSH